MDYPDVVAVVNLKGGVGKTTLCVNLAYGLAYFADKKVLLVDLDPQANATQYLISQRTYRKLYIEEGHLKKTIVDVYDSYTIADRADVRPSLSEPENYLQRVYTGKRGFLDLLASTLELSLLAFEVAHLPKYDQIRWFIESVGGEYDVVIIDCPPTVSSMLVAGLDASQSILVPIKPDFLSTIGLPLLHRVITRTYPRFIKRAEWLDELSTLGLVYTMVNDRLTMTRESKFDVRREARRLGYPIFSSYLSNTTKFAWSSKVTLPIFRSEPRSRYAIEVLTLVNEFLDKLRENS